MSFHRSVLKWAGSKYNALRYLLPELPTGRRLIEPFTGGGTIFLNTHYDAYLLAESNPDLINFFTLLQSYGETFIKACELMFQPQFNQASEYYRIRTQFNQSQDQMERAILFLYLNRHGYNGLCRYNKNNGFNVPFGRYIKPYFPKKEMRYFFEKSQSSQFILSDFRDTFNKAERGDVIYCDPPYVALSKSANFSSYTAQKFSEHEQIILAGLAKSSAEKNISVVLSNHDTPFTRHHYREAELISFPVNRSISSNGKQRKPVMELLAIFR